MGLMMLLMKLYPGRRIRVWSAGLLDMTRHVGWILRRNDLEFNHLIFLFFLNHSFAYWKDALHLDCVKPGWKGTLNQQYPSPEWKTVWGTSIWRKKTSTREHKLNPMTWNCEKVTKVGNFEEEDKDQSFEFLPLSSQQLTDCNAPDCQEFSRGCFYTQLHQLQHLRPALDEVDRQRSLKPGKAPAFADRLKNKFLSTWFF